MNGKIDKDKKDKYGVCRNDIAFKENDVIRIPMDLKYTFKQYGGTGHFANMKRKYLGRRARVKDIAFVFNLFWRLNFQWIDGYTEDITCILKTELKKLRFEK